MPISEKCPQPSITQFIARRFRETQKSVYQHCANKHLQRHINEFEFRYNTRETTDAERTELALKGIEGKHLTYQRIDWQTQNAHA